MPAPEFGAWTRLAAGLLLTVVGGSALGAFEPPRIADDDMAHLPMSIQMKISSAYSRASRSPEDAENLSVLGALYYVHGFGREAAQCLERVAEIKGKYGVWWYYTGLAYEKARDPARAIAAYEKVLSITGGGSYEPACVRLAELLLPTNPARAGELCRKGIELNRTSARAHYCLGRAAKALGRPEEALAAFQKAVGYAPTFAEAHLAAAEVLTALGRSEEADKHRRLAAAGGDPPELDDPATVALHRAGLHPKILCDDALVLARQGDLRQAQDMLVQARQIGTVGTLPDEVEATLLFLQRRYEEAAAKFRKILEVNPRSLSVRSALAQVVAELGQLDEAERLLRENLAQDPAHATTLQRFDALMKQRGKPRETEEFLQAAMAADPENADLHFQYALWLEQNQRRGEAIPALRRAIELRPEHSGARTLLATCLHRQGDLAGSRAEWERTLETNPWLVSPYLALATLAQEQGDQRAAARILQQGLNYIPDSAGMLNSLAWLLATSPDDSLRNGPQAVELARKACALTGNRDHTYLDTLGAAYAEVGQFTEAIKATRAAADLASQLDDKSFAETYRQRLELYRQRKPYRERP